MTRRGEVTVSVAVIIALVGSLYAFFVGHRVGRDQEFREKGCKETIVTPTGVTFEVEQPAPGKPEGQF